MSEAKNLQSLHKLHKHEFMNHTQHNVRCVSFETRVRTTGEKADRRESTEKGSTDKDEATSRRRLAQSVHGTGVRGARLTDRARARSCGRVR